MNSSVNFNATFFPSCAKNIQTSFQNFRKYQENNKKSRTNFENHDKIRKIETSGHPVWQ